MQVAELRAKGEALLEREAAVFEAEMGRKNGQDARWLQQVRRSGTTSDKVAAITLLLQVSVGFAFLYHPLETSANITSVVLEWASSQCD